MLQYQNQPKRFGSRVLGILGLGSVLDLGVLEVLEVLVWVGGFGSPFEL